MIMPNEEHEEEKEKPELTPEQAFKCFFMLIGKCGGKVSFKAESIEKVPDNFDMNYSYDEKLDVWTFEIPGLRKKRKRGIVKPKKKRIILPG